MLEWDKDRNGLSIPKWQGRLLASKVDAKKEAQDWVKRIESDLKNCEFIFVLGFGAGHHAIELAKIFSEIQIIVFEARAEFLKIENGSSLSLPANLTVLSALTPDLIATNPLVRDALGSTFLIARHAPTIQVDKNYYSSVESILSGTTRESFFLHLQCRPEQKPFFDRLDVAAPLKKKDTAYGIHEIATGISELGKPLDSEAMIWLALRELIV